MIEQFQKILQTPKPSSQNYMKLIQDAMLNTMQNIMPKGFDFRELSKIIGKETEYQNLASVTYKLTQFFVKVIQQNFIDLQSYYLLEHQTQKLQSTIRSHIKMQQQMKMYLEHLEYKIQRYEYHLQKLRKHRQNLESSEELNELKEKYNNEELKKRETQLMKERLVLLRKVDHLERKLNDQKNQLTILNSPASATIQQIKEGLNRERSISQVKFPNPNEAENNIDFHKPLNDIDRRMSTNSFGSDYQITQKKSSHSLNVAQTYRLYSLTGKDSAHVHNFTSNQLMDTIKQISVAQSKNIIFMENNNSPIQYLVQIQ